MSWTICIFARNAAAALPDTLAALDAAALGRPFRLHLIDCASRDETAALMAMYAAVDLRATAHTLPSDDLASAWNYAIHRLWTHGDTLFFLEAQAHPSPASFHLLAERLRAAPDALAAGALPAPGIGRRGWLTSTFRKKCLNRSLFALSDRFIGQLRSQDMFLPAGFAAPDALLTHMINTLADTDSASPAIVLSPGAIFSTAERTPSPKEALAWAARHVEKAREAFEWRLLKERLETGGLAAMPAAASELFSAEAVSRLKPRAGLAPGLIDWLAIRSLRRRP